MNIKNLLLTALLLGFSTIYGGTYQTISSIKEIAPVKEAVIFSDLNETLFESSQQLGSKKWRNQIKATTSQELHDELTWFASNHFTVQPTEPDTADFVRSLQKDNQVFGLTAKERNIWYYTPQEGVDVLTVGHLHSVDIRLDTPEDYWITPEFYEGVYFCDLDTKGEYLLKLFKEHQPRKVVFIDDKIAQIDSVAEALESLGIAYDCYLYQPVSKTYDPLVAAVQLYHLWYSHGTVNLTDQEAMDFIQQHPENDLEYYLTSVYL